MSAIGAVGRAGGRAVASIVGDVRFAVVLTVGVAVGGFLAMWYFHEWERGRKHVKFGIGSNPDVVPPPANVKTPTPPGQPAPKTPLPGPKNGGVLMADRAWQAGPGIRAAVEPGGPA